MDSLLFNNHHPSPKPQPPPPPSQLLLDRRAAAAAAPAEKAPLPCPRCESTNTKFCYYNNYNLSQPRHFCKACRRYWTRGGTLRNVPVGGGTRKSTTSNSSSSNNNNKRPRVTTPAPAPTNHHNIIDSNNDHVPHGTQTESTVTALDPGQAEVADVEKQPGSLSGCCWWSGGQMGAGFLPTLMNGYELGLGYYEQAGALDWPNIDQVRGGDGTTTVMQQHHQGEEEEESSLGCDTWQVGSVGGGDNGVAGGGGGDFLSWPELAISTSTPAAKALK